MYRIYMHSIKYAVQRSYCRHCVNCRAKKTTILLTTLHHIENWIKLTLICFDRLALKEEKKRRKESGPNLLIIGMTLRSKSGK